MKPLVIRTLVACVVVVAPGSVRAQSASATLAGTVRTEGGAPVAEAIVQARGEATGTVRTAISDRGGRYRLEGLSPGIWRVVARLGDALSDTRTVTLRLQQKTTVDFTVGGGLSEEVVVRAEAPLVDPKETAGALRVAGDQADQLPIAGRVMTDLALLDSSVRQAAPGNFAGERGAVFVVNGQSGRSNSFLVDGLDNNDSTSGTTTNSFFSQQVIQEFVLLTHQYSPEFGGASGGLLNIVTRKGTNHRSFDAFVQGTNDNWNSTGAFVESLPDGGVSRDAVRRFQTGLAFGGPMRKDRAFYFAAYEHQETDDLVSYTGIDAGGQEGGRLIAPSENDNLFLRTDFNLGARHSLMLRLSVDDRSAEGINVGGVATPETGFGVEEQDLQLAATLTSTISPRALSETRLLVSTSRFEQLANSDLPGVTRPSGIFGGNVLNRQIRDEDKLQLVENLTWNAGPHTLKFGIDVVRSMTTIDARFNPSGNFIYDYDLPFQPGADGDILVSQIDSKNPDCTVPNLPGEEGEPGNICSYPVVYSMIFGEPRARLDDTRVSLFAQDRVEIGKRWLLDYGLRYDVSTYELPASAKVDSASIANGGSKADTNNVAPRFGFTFTPTTDGRTVVRGGGGVFYDKLVLAFPAVAAVTSGTRIGIFPIQGFAFEFTEDDIVTGEDIPLLFPEPLTMRFSTGTELETPYTVQYNLGFERAIGSHSAFRADVVRALGYHLPLIKDLNPVSGLVSGIFGLPLLTGELTACPVEDIEPDREIGVPCHARDPEHGSIAAIVTEGRSWYTGLDLDYRWRRDDSWFRVSYTLSRAEDLGFDPLKGGISLPPDSTDIAGERGRSDGDRLHRLVVSGETPLLFAGLKASAVIQLSSGMPYNVTTGQDDNLDGILSDRPEGVGRNEGEDSSLAAINAVRDQEVVPLDPIAALPDEPSFFQVDLRVSRSFRFNEKTSGDFFVQVFNVLDRENVGLLEGRAISPNFGRPVSLAGPPRTVELGFRVSY